MSAPTIPTTGLYVMRNGAPARVEGYWLNGTARGIRLFTDSTTFWRMSDGLAFKDTDCRERDDAKFDIVKPAGAEFCDRDLHPWAPTWQSQHRNVITPVPDRRR